jgi:DNA repair exonuclease SbcCD ATPase subunit
MNLSSQKQAQGTSTSRPLVELDASLAVAGRLAAVDVHYKAVKEVLLDSQKELTLSQAQLQKQKLLNKELANDLKELKSMLMGAQQADQKAQEKHEEALRAGQQAKEELQKLKQQLQQERKMHWDQAQEQGKQLQQAREEILALKKQLAEKEKKVQSQDEFFKQFKALNKMIDG